MNKNMKHTTLTAAAVFSFTLLASYSARAATNGTWANGGTDWNTFTDWVSNIPPTAGGTATFTGAEVSNPNISTSVSIGQLNFATSGTGYNVTASSGQTLTLTNVGTSSGSVAINAGNTSGINTITAPIVLGGASGSTEEFLQASGGSLIINGAISDGGNGIALALATGTITLSGNNTYSGGTTITGSAAAAIVTSLGNAGSSGNLGTGAISLNGGETDLYGLR